MTSTPDPLNERRAPKIEGHHWGWQGPFERVLYRDDGSYAGSIISWFGFGHAKAFIDQAPWRSEWQSVKQAYAWMARTIEVKERGKP